ncbi:MAG: hypothetical protein ACI4QT_10315 [Kiritimatiellia bacterium]
MKNRLVVAFFAFCLPCAFAVEVMVTADRVNLRAAPNGNAEVIGQVMYEERLELKGDLSEPWVKVGIPARFHVWMYSKLIRNGKVVVNSALVRAGAGLNYNVVGEIERGTLLEERGTFGDWTKLAPLPQCFAYITNCYVAAVASDAPPAKQPVLETTAKTEERQTAPVVAPIPEKPAEDLPSLPAIEAEKEKAGQPGEGDETDLTLETVNGERAAAPEPVEIPAEKPAIETLPVAPVPEAADGPKPRPPRRTLLGDSPKTEPERTSRGIVQQQPDSDRTPIGPGKIPACRLRTKTEQALPGVYAGELASTPLVGMHPTRFCLVSYDAGHRSKIVAYVYGNSRQLQSMKGDTMTISGAVYWFKETELPTIFAQDILRGKAEK